MISVRNAHSDEDKKAGLRILLGHIIDNKEREELVTELFTSGQEGSLDFTHLSIAFIQNNNDQNNNEKITEDIAAGYFMIQEDRSAIVWSPVAVDSHHPLCEPAIDALLADAKRVFQEENCWIGQILIDPKAVQDRERLARNGFSFLTDLNFLRISRQEMENVLAENSTNTPPWEEVTFVDSCNQSRFETLLQETYINSLDCPEIIHCRTPKQALLGHQAGTTFEPSLWKLYSQNSQDFAVLLMHIKEDLQELEVSYIGISPCFRGKKLGEAVLKEAFKTAIAHDLQSVLIAVDQRNLPAVRLYGKLNMTLFLTRSVHAWLKDKVVPNTASSGE